MLNTPTTIDGRYKIIKELGRGYYNQTYLVEDIRRMNRQCILKILEPISRNLKKLENIERVFDDEVSTLEKLAKENNQIPQLQDYFTVGQEFYLVQELISGCPISQLISDNQRLSEDKVVNILLEVLDVLSFVHKHQIIHQDIQPSNLIQSYRGENITLINFGAIKQAHPIDQKDTNLIPVYVPDEQIKGKPYFSSDIYALGVTAIEMLTGTIPTQSQKYLQEKFVCSDQVSVSADLLVILNKMVSFHVSDRYQSADNVVQDLNKLRSKTCSDYKGQTVELPKQKKLLVSVRNACFAGSALLALGLIGIQVSASRSGSSSEQHHEEIHNPRHLAAVHGVSVSPNGQIFASSSFDRTIKLWDFNTGELLQTLDGHTAAVHTIIFSRDGQKLASSSHDGTIKLWDLNTGSLIRTFVGHEGHTHSIVFTPDERILVSGSGDGTIKLWDLYTGAEIRTIYARSGHVNSVALSPDGQTIISGSREGPVELWNIRTGKQIRSLAAHSSYVNVVAITPNGQTVISSSLDGPIQLWNIQTGKPLPTLKDGVRATALAISPDGQILASNSADQKIKLWNLHTGKLLSTVSGDVAENSKNYNSVTFSPDGETLISGSSFGAIKVWRLSELGI